MKLPSGGVRGPKTPGERAELKDIGQRVQRVAKPLEKPVKALEVTAGQRRVPRAAGEEGVAAEQDRVALEQLSVADPWPWSVDLFRIQREIVQPRLESAVIQGQNARAILSEARALALEPT